MPTTATRKRTVKKLTAKKRLEELQSFVSLCFIMLEGQNFHQIADKAMLSHTTIYRLFHGQYSRAVRFGTIQALGIAAGLRLEMTEYDCKVTIAE